VELEFVIRGNGSLPGIRRNLEVIQEVVRLIAIRFHTKIFYSQGFTPAASWNKKPYGWEILQHPSKFLKYDRTGDVIITISIVQLRSKGLLQGYFSSN